MFTTQRESKNMKRDFHYTTIFWKSESQFALRNDNLKSGTILLTTQRHSVNLKMAATSLRSRSRWQRLRCVVARDGSDYAA